MNPRRRDRRRWLGALILANAALVPWLVLIPIGGLWLWQQGYLLWWLLAAGALGIAGYAYARRLRGEFITGKRELEATHEQAESAPDEGWAPHDRAAWQSVQALASRADPDIITDHERLLATAVETLECVAQHYHPGQRHAIWNFTAPEALLLTERISARLREILLDRVPGSHMIRIGQLVELWEWRPMAERGVSIARGLGTTWRVVRLINPLNALLAEARHTALAAALGETGTYLRRRGTRIWIEEVGRAGIELYSGRLHLDPDRLREAAATEGAGPAVSPAELPGPLRIVVIGQVNAGKSSLVNALLEDVVAGVDVLRTTAAATAYELRLDGTPEALLIDTPGLGADQSEHALVDLVWDSDCVVWVTAAHRADRAAERRALEAIRARFHTDPRRSPPPLLVVASHIDRVSPAREWMPPYDIATPTRPKERNIRDALEAIATDLEVPLDSVVPMRLDARGTHYNMDLLWAKLLQQFDDARRSRILRVSATLSRRDWRRVLRQARRAGAFAGQLLKQRDDT